MAKKINNIPRDNNILRVPLEEAMPDNYLPYAIEVAKDRALPDVRDGLKPVHRRILYGSYLLKAFPDRPYYKSARIVGDILGKFHPHGDTSVYDAMVILAQDFSTREPLIDGHGNWGSVDGDGAAAMRYTEARLSKIAMEMLRDIDKDTVEMVPNYSDSEWEPKVLPSRYPNLLVNGAFGIAVGLATNIPPHNLGEVTSGVLALIDNPEISTRDLMHYIKGPDLPTGGILIGKNSLISAYETGEGKVTCRAKTSIEKLESGRLGIVITEFPYRRNKAKILQTISEMTGDKRHAKALEAITDIRDESDRSGTRAVIEFKKAADQDSVDKVLKYLFKKTDLQCNISFNMVALAEGKPQTMGLKVILEHYIKHQKDIVTRRTKKELDIAEKRFHIVEGFIKAINVLDEVIATIRESKSKKDANDNLIAKFGFTEAQSTAILELMLYRLTGLEIKVFQKEYKELEKEIKKLKKILSDEKELLEVIKNELKEITEKYINPRRTEIVEDDSEAKIDVEELIIIEDTMITLSKDGFIKRIPLKNYNRSNSNPEDIEYREGDELKFLESSNTRDTVLFFGESGFVYQMKGINIPELKWKEKGERLDTLIRGLNLDEDTIVGVISIDNFHPNKEVEIITNGGGIKRTSLEKLQTNYSKLQGTKLKDGQKIIKVSLKDKEEKDNFIKINTKMGLEFTVEMPVVEESTRNILPGQLFNLPSFDEVINIESVESMEYLEFTIGITNKGTLKYFARSSDSNPLKTSTDSLSKVLLFTNRGNVITLDSYMLHGVLKEEIPLNKIIEGLQKDEEIIAIESIKYFDENRALYFYTKKGLVKKTILKEYENLSMIAQGYKLRNENDEVVSVALGEIEKGNIIIVTKKGMGIKFSATSVTNMGRIASGVTGISLRDEDEVIVGYYISEESNKKIQLTSKNKENSTVSIEEIKLQNRAGRGSSLMIIVLEDEIKNVNLS